jgi:FlaA1/EpsC-like NDP-sugar epimerase
MIDTLHHAGTIAVVIATVFAWAFVIGYSRDPWRLFEAGRHLMVFTFGHAVLLTYIVWRNVIVSTAVSDPVPEVVRFVAFVFLAVMFVWRFRILRRGQLAPPRPALHD